MLTAYTQAPVVAQTAVKSDLLHALKIFAEFVVQSVIHDLAVLSVNNIFLSVEEPVGDLVLARILNYGHNFLPLLLGKFSRSLVHVDIGLLTHDVCVSAT